jgi:ABC-type phosphate/phosphonate transport system substrate-binding protein
VQPRAFLRFGVSASHGGAHLLDGANQFVTALTTLLGKPVRLWVAPDYEHLLKAITDCAIEMAWMPPLLQARALAAGARLVAAAMREGQLTYRSALLVRSDAPWRHVTELRKVRAAWVEPSSASGHVFPRMHILAATCASPVDVFASEMFEGSFALVCAAVAQERADLCACFVKEAAHRTGQVLEDLRAGFGWPVERLRVLDVTDAITPDGIVLAKGAADEHPPLSRTLLALHEIPDGAAALSTLLRADMLVVPTADVEAAVARLQSRMRNTLRS